MKRSLAWLGLPLVAVVGAWMVQVARSVYRDGGCEVRGLGGCTIENSRAACWDMEGSVSPDLTAKVQVGLDAMRFPLPFEAGVKNRYLVAKYTTHGAFVSFGSLSGPALPLSRTPGEGLYLLHATPSSDRKAASITAWISTPEKPVILPFHEGAKIAVLGQEVAYGMIRALASSDVSVRMDPFRGFRHWQISLGGHLVRSDARYFGFVALDASRKPIQSVDITGAPAPFDEVQAWLKKSAGGVPISEIRYAPARVDLSIDAPEVNGAFALTTNIDPTAIKFLEITVYDRKPVEIGEFPLDPKTVP